MSGCNKDLSDLVNMVKVWREKALLGLYSDSVRKFEYLLSLINDKWQETTDEYWLSRWKSTEKSLHEEMNVVKELANSVECLKTGELSLKRSSTSNTGAKAEERPIKNASLGKQPVLRKAGSHNDHLNIEIKAPGQKI